MIVGIVEMMNEMEMQRMTVMMLGMDQNVGVMYDVDDGNDGK